MNRFICDDDEYYHQNTEDWLSWCRANLSDIKSEYLRRMDSSISTQDFFGDWCSYQRHSDVGYFLGCEFIRYLQRQYSLLEIANLDTDRLYQHFRAFAQE